MEAQQPADRSRAAAWAVVAFALVLPTLVTWVYFVALANAPAAVQQTSYAIGKAIQFGLPVVWVWLILRERPRLVRPAASELALGFAFGILVMAAMLALYHFALEPWGLFAGPAQEVRDKVKSFGVSTLFGYVLLSVFYSAIHSLLEEYYWRWFAFGQLRRLAPLAAAIAISSVGFAAHHVLVLGTYFGYGSPLTWLFTVGIVVGGAFWAWLYHRSRSLWGPWLSHALVDATIFVIGWDLITQGP
jgi:membrane protease YdiL (CAAX protease family)